MDNWPHKTKDLDDPMKYFRWEFNGPPYALRRRRLVCDSLEEALLTWFDKRQGRSRVLYDDEPAGWAHFTYESFLKYPGKNFLTQHCNDMKWDRNKVIEQAVNMELMREGSKYKAEFPPDKKAERMYDYMIMYRMDDSDYTGEDDRDILEI